MVTFLPLNTRVLTHPQPARYKRLNLFFSGHIPVHQPQLERGICDASCVSAFASVNGSPERALLADLPETDSVFLPSRHDF